MHKYKEDFRTFSQFLIEANVAEIDITIDKNNPPTKSKLLEDILKITSDLGVSLLEDIGKTGDTFVGYGVKGKLKAKGEQDDKAVINPNVEISKDDKKTLAEIDGKITRAIQLFGDLEEFLSKYGKINAKPITTVLSQLKSFQEAIQDELSKLPG